MNTQKTIISAKTAAGLCGVSLATLYTWACHREIPTIRRKGKRTMYCKEDIIDWLAEGEVKPVKVL
jgi:predicted DNA-binding transcriptional regulator AlpA